MLSLCTGLDTRHHQKVAIIRNSKKEIIFSRFLDFDEYEFHKTILSHYCDKGAANKKIELKYIRICPFFGGR